MKALALIALFILSAPCFAVDFSLELGMYTQRFGATQYRDYRSEVTEHEPITLDNYYGGDWKYPMRTYNRGGADKAQQIGLRVEAGGFSIIGSTFINEYDDRGFSASLSYIWSVTDSLSFETGGSAITGYREALVTSDASGTLSPDHVQYASLLTLRYRLTNSFDVSYALRGEYAGTANVNLTF